MNEIVRKDITAVLDRLLEIMKEKSGNSAVQIKELSNHVIHNASVFQDEDSISIAILSYSIAKIIERNENVDYEKLGSFIASANIAIKSSNHDLFDKSVQKMFGFIRTVDQKLGLYIQEVIGQAQVKKGCDLCEHGVSVGRASEILGISQWELMKYLGQTTVIDRISEPSGITSRLKFARGLFR